MSDLQCQILSMEILCQAQYFFFFLLLNNNSEDFSCLHFRKLQTEYRHDTCNTAIVENSKLNIGIQMIHVSCNCNCKNNKSKTEMTASVQENESKHTKGSSNECYLLIWTRQNKISALFCLVHIK